MKTKLQSPLFVLPCALAFLAMLSAFPGSAQTFTNIQAGLPGVQYPSVAWGDYDNDGRLDLLISGDSQNDGRICQVWHNNGNGSFSNINAGLPGVGSGSVAWGDYDNDGYLDILLLGSGIDTPQVWRNNGNGTFSNINVGLPPFNNGSAAWGDYDNDGHLDILLTGGIPYVGYATQLWRNNGNGTFSLVNVGLPTGYDCRAAWGDFDNDGRQDVLLQYFDELSSSYKTEIWRNNGDGTFTNLNAGLPGLSRGSFACGDYDHDGRLDVLITGVDYSSSPPTAFAQLWRNNGNGTFTKINSGLPQFTGYVAWGDFNNDGQLDLLFAGSLYDDNNLIEVWQNNGDGTFSNKFALATGFIDWDGGSVSWGDYDNDGNLDFLLSGDGYPVYAPICNIYRNTSAIANTPPTTPSGLRVTMEGGTYVLHWNAASDAQTPASGLTYNVRVGSTPGGSDILSANADPATGARRLPQPGNAQGNLFLRVSPSVTAPVGRTWYWSVQAIDSVLVGSHFAAEANFAAVGPPEVVTLPATNISAFSSTLPGLVNPAGAPTIGWIEWGLTSAYGARSTPVSLGSGSLAQPIAWTITNLSVWGTYHYRVVASNQYGLATAPEVTLTIQNFANPTILHDTATALMPFFLPAMGQPPDSLSILVRSDNPVLVPNTTNAIVVSGSGASRTLRIIPAAGFSGTANITVLISDGVSTIEKDFTVTVLPQSGPLLYLTNMTNAHVPNPLTLRFRMVDAGSGSTNYTVEYRPDLSPTNTWTPAANATALAGGVFQVAVPTPAVKGFFRVKGLRNLVASFSTTSLSAEEGSGTVSAVVVFNAPYQGTLRYTVGGTAGPGDYGALSGLVVVNGNTAAIPITLGDNLTIDQLRYLTLQLQPGSDFQLGTASRLTLTIADNDALWKGTVLLSNGLAATTTTLVTNSNSGGGYTNLTLPQNANTSLNFILKLQQSSGACNGALLSDAGGFFPTNETPAQVSFTGNHFAVSINNVALPNDSSLLGSSLQLNLALNADNGTPNQTVSSTAVSGQATLALVSDAFPFLNVTNSGTFQLFRPAPQPATNDVNFVNP